MIRACRAALALLCLFGCSKKSDSSNPVVTTVAATVNAGAVTGTLAPLWRDHYDLSYHHKNYPAEAGFLPIVTSLLPRSWRCSVGRWEIGYLPPTGGDSTDPNVLKTVDREFYRGANTLVDADDPAKYDFTYLDAQLAALAATGAQPYLCFDYMPFTLSSEQNPLNANNLGLTQAQYSFSNGIRTAPPIDAAIYARVVRNVVRHVRGLFAGTTNTGIVYIEVGNEPDLLDGTLNPSRIFWTGTRWQWIAMYNAVAAAIAGDASISGLVKLGGGSFALQPFEPSPYFMQSFLVDVSLNGTRLDFLSFHSYGDDPLDHYAAADKVQSLLAALVLSPEKVNAEWGRTLNGDDPVYDRIEHGLFRAKAMVLMQLFGISTAHESLFRDVTATVGNLGIVSTGPAAKKPVTDVYLALQKLNPTPNALSIAAPGGTYMIAGRDALSTRVVIVYVGDDPGAGAQTAFQLAVSNLPWGALPYNAMRYEVSEATWSAGEGVKLVSTQLGLTGAFSSAVTFGPGPGAGRLLVWELVKQ